ncbi:Epsin-1, required for endocytosis and actin patch assembly [Perkinsus olseni]|uniref:Epsin-1, required for endocytosis and actin patch assembly n=3 Tax=Perkinsus olseni TaxID=32597 RepID=A0A7J6M2P3_PEROL|nr:Epsin-1, required for endocytosis and actin patch assembly [Perkinsus olseni]KAF4668089.1 Epsin-1, required for endocytosis and actin patch assembly [Perkinsus olseni]
MAASNEPVVNTVSAGEAGASEKNKFVTVTKGAYTRMVIIGIGYLFPISAIWAAFDYWKTLFPDKNIEFVVTCLYQFGSVMTVLILSLGKSMKFHRRILGGFSGQFCCLFVIFLFRWLGLPVNVVYGILLGLVFLMSVVTGFLDSALLALNSQYSPKMQEALQIGIGFSTFVSVVYRDITKLISTSQANSTSIYFLAALATVIVCISAYVSLMRMPISAHIHEEDASSRQQPLLEKKEEEEVNIWKVLRRVWFNELVIFLNFLLTTACYPAILTAIPCYTLTVLAPAHWYQTILLSVFTVFDVIARFCVRHRGPLYYGNIWITAAVRMCIFPLVVLCATGTFRNDWFSMFIVALFGFGNGFAGSLSLITINEIPGLSGPELKATGRFSAVAVNSGLCVGGFVAMGLGVWLGLA